MIDLMGGCFGLGIGAAGFSSRTSNVQQAGCSSMASAGMRSRPRPWPILQWRSLPTAQRE